MASASSTMALYDSEGDILVNEETMVKYGRIPLNAINMASMRALSRTLNLKSESVVKKGVAQGMPPDWRGLAEISEYFDLTDIRNFANERDPTEACVNEMVNKSDATFQKLLRWLHDLGREDLIEDLKPSLERDVQSYLRRQEKKYPGPVQVPEVSDSFLDHAQGSDTEMMTIHDEKDNPATFDAFVCSSQSPEDMKFVRKMIEVLEGKFGLKLCVSARDLVAGDSNTITAAVIHQRCRRMVIVLSPDFCASPACDFQVKFAQTLSPGSRSKKLIPIIYKKCRELPLVLRHISPIDYTKAEHIDWFWDRLGKTLGFPLTWNRSDMTSNCDLPINQLESSASSSSIGPSDQSGSVQPSDRLAEPEAHPRSAEVLREALVVSQHCGSSASVQGSSEMDCDGQLDSTSSSSTQEKQPGISKCHSVSQQPAEKKKKSKLKAFFWKSLE